MVALPFALNLLFNALFTPIQFGLQNNILASIDILLVVGTLLWAFVAIWNALPEMRWIVYINIPYLLWGTYATVLQLTITYLNRV
jgi:tryptophan-rich sensory protein